MLGPGTYSLDEKVSLLVSNEGTMRIDSTLDNQPDTIAVRAAARSRFRVLLTLGPWQKNNTGWYCAVTSAITARL